MVVGGVTAMGFNSILWPDGQKGNLAEKDPEFFVDLNIDQIINGVIEGYGDYDLRPVFGTMPKNIHTVRYRQEVFKDLQNPDNIAFLKGFSSKMKGVNMRLFRIEELYEYQKQGWFLEAALLYFDALRDLSEKLKHAELNSEGLRSFRDYIQTYVDSSVYREASEEAMKVKANLSAITYEMSIGSARISVRKDRGRENYNEIIREAFIKFKENRKQVGKRQHFSESTMNHVEFGVLELIARLFPEEFRALISFHKIHSGFIDPVVAEIYRELQFYISYLEYISPLMKEDLEFCIPEMGNERDLYCLSSFDLALAHKLTSSGSRVITNDFNLSGGENTIVVTGPNNGGKSTFARSLGQVYFLAALGLPIPGKKSKLFLVDNIYTHFEKSEDPDNLMGKLENDLVKMKKILNLATERSVIIINEMLSSTASTDAIQIGKRIIDLIGKKNSICVYVTFLDEFARIRGVVSMVSQVDPSASEMRTFRVVRSDPNGLAYAMSLAEKYELTYEKIAGRIKE
ncbi:MAG: MutS-related protein [Cuniculiplasma sp.]